MGRYIFLNLKPLSHFQIFSETLNTVFWGNCTVWGASWRPCGRRRFACTAFNTRLLRIRGCWCPRADRRWGCLFLRLAAALFFGSWAVSSEGFGGRAGSILRFVGLDSFLTARSLTAAVAQCGLIACLAFSGRL